MTTSRFTLLTLSSLLLVAAGRPAGQEAPPWQRPLDPAGAVVLDASGHAAEGALPVTMLRSPDRGGPDGLGRYLIVVNSGYGSQVSHTHNKARQSLQVVDLVHDPEPVVIQEVYFPSPQSANVGAAFAGAADAEGRWPLLVSGGFENRVWRLSFTPGTATPITPVNETPTSPLQAPSIDIASAAGAPGTKGYNEGLPPAYATGLAVGASGTLYVAANLGDALAVVTDPLTHPKVRRVDLHRPKHGNWFVYPYDVRAVRARGGHDKVFVSLWNDASVAVVDGRSAKVIGRIDVGAHPGAMALNASGSRLAVASANADTVSIIDTTSDREIERIGVGLGDPARTGDSPQAVAFDAGGRALFVANAQTQSVAVVRLSADARGAAPARKEDDDDDRGEAGRSRVAGYLPTARYPTALAVAGNALFVGDGKGEPPARGNAPNAEFPANHVLRGPYSVAVIAGSLRRIPLPDGAGLGAMTTRVLAANGLIGAHRSSLFSGPSPIRHVVYIIKENRTYDQVLGDLEASGDGSRADGDPALTIFGAGAAARRADGPPQDISPNHHQLALRFGLFDRFFVNSEASPDGHAWATSAFSTDYVDKAFRWEYSGRGRTYDYEGFNRLPSFEGGRPSDLRLPATALDVAAFMKRYVPYLNGSRDVAEPDSLYLWDAAAKAGLTYRNYGEFVGTISAGDVEALNGRRSKKYPDTSATVAAFATKRSLEGHFNPAYPNFDLTTPDAFTTEGYAAVKQERSLDPVMRVKQSDHRFRGTSRLGIWLDEFQANVADLEAGRGDHLPALSIVRFSNDHTAGMAKGHPTPQFYMADNDYAVGRLVQAVSHSPYWRDTAILVLEDDAQDGADHVDVHRSPVLVISAYNRKGALIHEMHNTVSLIRTLELLLGLSPMNELDANAVPMDIFTDTPDLTPYDAILPEVALDNLMLPPPTSPSARRWTSESDQQDLQNPDMADAGVLNRAIWFSVRGDAPMPDPSRLAAVDAMQTGIDEEGENAASQPLVLARLALRRQLHMR